MKKREKYTVAKMYRCMRCRELKPQFGFNVDNTRPTKRKVQAFCKKCKKVYAQLPSQKTRSRISHLRKFYGLTFEQVNEMIKVQNNICPICLKAPQSPKTRWNVDHDHKTGKVRGILCNLCNMGIGHLKDDVTLLQNAINYLQIRRVNA